MNSYMYSLINHFWFFLDTYAFYINYIKLFIANESLYANAFKDMKEMSVYIYRIETQYIIA